VYYDGKCEVTGGANPVTRLRLCPGKTSFITMEPAVFRYLKLYVRPWAKPGARPVSATGAEPLQVRIGMPESIEYMCPDTHAGSFQCSDDDVNRLYAAARQTLRMNTLDIFMDCPERERGGWLCDSLWTARAFRMMMGHSGTEKAFIENFLLTPADSMWHGFFPEVYPAVKPNFNECPGLLTWSFWLMEELCEYVRRSGDMEFALKYKKRVAAFVHGSLELRGESGLMENMPWVFIDWSFSNDFCRPISTAANALYARVLLDLGELYGEPGWAEEGAKIRSILRKTLCKNDKKPVEPGGFLPDALEYRNGQLHRCGNYSESAQYTMLWAGLFTRDELPDYFWRVIHTSGPAREYPGDNKLGSANLFIGLCIRLDLLARLGEYEILLRELKAIYYPQLREGPGTLWEVTDVVNTSRCHGFSAHAGVQLMRDILGIGEPDELTRTVKIEPHPCGLRWARGVVQTPEGLITLFWTNKDGKLDMKLTLPEGWRAV